MLEYELLGIVDGVATYQYYPEGDRKNPGTIRFDSNFKMIDYVLSKRDEFARYVVKLFSWFKRKGRFKEKGFIAWG